MKRDIYAEVTNQIIQQLEAGTPVWRKSWRGNVSRPLRHNYQPYTGANVLMLWAVGEQRGYVSPVYMTYNQAKALGGHVKKGEKSAPVVYYDTFSKEDDNGEEKKIPFLKSYSVFNVEQIEGLPASFYAEEGELLPESERIERAEAFFKATGADIRHGGHRAFYSKEGDFIQMPDFSRFISGEAYYSVLSHEACHWSGAASRLNRDLSGKFGEPEYAFEELISELGAAYCCADLQIKLHIEDHAAYIASWLKLLREDKRAIFKAAALASKAVEYLSK